MRDIVIDVQVMMSASGTGDPVNHYNSKVLLERIVDGKEVVLAVDDESLIVTQYKTKLGTGVYAMKWLQLMASRGRVNPIQRATVSKAERSRLNGAFSTSCEDYHYYVRTAAASVSRCLVSHDDDYTAAACNLLRRCLGVTVRSAVDAATHL